MSAGGGLIAASSVGSAKSLEAMQWYTIRTRSRHERAVERQLHRQGVEVLCPVVRQFHSWSDRRKLIDRPLFAGYAFGRIVSSFEQRVKVLQTHGMFEIVERGQNQDVLILQEQIDAVRTALLEGIPFSEHVFLSAVNVCEFGVVRWMV